MRVIIKKILTGDFWGMLRTWFRYEHKKLKEPTQKQEGTAAKRTAGSMFWSDMSMGRPIKQKRMAPYKVALVVGLVVTLVFISIWTKTFLGDKKHNATTGSERVVPPGTSQSEESEIGRSNYSADSQPVIAVSPLQTALLSQTPNGPINDWHTYSNSEYGFKARFSDVWLGYLFEKKSDYSGTAEVVFEVKLPSVAPSVPLTFYLYRPDKWNEDDGVAEIARNARYIYAYKMWEGPPLDPNTLPDKEISDVVRSFELI